MRLCLELRKTPYSKQLPGPQSDGLVDQQVVSSTLFETQTDPSDARSGPVEWLKIYILLCPYFVLLKKT